VLLRSNGRSFSKIFGLVLAIAVTLPLGLLCWKFRPRLTPDVSNAVDSENVLVTEGMQ